MSLQGVREYLAAAKLGKVTPFMFMRHLNSIILPSLGKRSTVSRDNCSLLAVEAWLSK
jgi:hypothetical protein